MRNWKERAVVGLMAVALIFETVPMSVFAAEGKIDLKMEEVSDFSKSTVSGNEMVMDEEIAIEETAKKIAKETAEEVELPIVAGWSNGIEWSFDYGTGTLTVTGEHYNSRGSVWYSSEYFEGHEFIYSIFSTTYGGSNVKHIVFKDCILKGSLQYMLYGLHCLESVEFVNTDISNVTSMHGMFSDCNNLTNLNLSNLDTSNVTDMAGMFEGCSNLASVNLSNLDTSNVTDMASMFESCRNLKSVNLSNLDTSNVTNMNCMFYGCSNLKSVDLSNFDTSNVTNMGNMFSNCSSLQSVNLSNFDTSNVILMVAMFSDCSSLQSVNLSNFDTSNVTNMYDMFYNCSSLQSVDLSNFDTSNAIYMGGMFSGCSSLRKLDISSFDTSKASADGGEGMLSRCSNLKTIHTPKAMASGQSIVLPYIYYDTQKRVVTELTTSQCNKLLVKNIEDVPVAPPSFEVKGVINGRDVTFNCDTEGAVIYYSSTTSNLTLNDQHVNVGETVTFSDFYGTIYARAYADGKWSNPAKLLLKIPKVNDPTITRSGTNIIVKTTTPGCIIYYTTDGSTPSPTNGTKLYGSSCTIPSVSGKVRAIAVRSCFANSKVVSQTMVASNIKIPSFGVVGVIGGRKVTFNNQTPGSKIYYSTSSTITARDKCVNSGGSVIFNDFYGTIYARTYSNGKWSNVSRLVLKIPTINRPTVEAVSSGKVKIKTTTPNCTIYYTTDGTTPSPNNGRRVNASSFTVYVGSGKTVKAIAVRSCFTNSNVATGRAR